MAGDFDKLFGDDWQPHDFDPARRGDEGEGAGIEGFPLPADSDFTTETENRTPRTLNEKEVKVVNVYEQRAANVPVQHFVLLRDNRGRRIRIFVGHFEATAISLAVEGEAPERPLTHDLVYTMIERLGGSVDRVIIDDLWNETFYAKICVIKPDGTPLEIDARSSDAIAIGVRARAPIYMAESVIEQAIVSESE